MRSLVYQMTCFRLGINRAVKPVAYKRRGHGAETPLIALLRDGNRISDLHSSYFDHDILFWTMETSVARD